MNRQESQRFFDEAFARKRAMVILRGFETARSLALCEKAWSAGIDVVEIPLQGDESFRVLRSVARTSSSSQPVGAGTIVSVALVEKAFEAGAAFTVAPGYDATVAERSLALGMPHLPGVATPTEIQLALSDELRWLKAFPASSLGAGWFSAMRGPFPQAHFVATGGVSGENARSFLEAGAQAVSLGAAFASLPLDTIREIG